MDEPRYERYEQVFHEWLGRFVDGRIEDDLLPPEQLMGAVRERTAVYRYLMARSQSPIENIMAAILAFVIDGYECLRTPDLVSDGHFTTVTAQASIDKYTVDFLLVVEYHGYREFLIIECDGHDYHERTKAQATHDKQRDRALTRQGYTILRFTGSELYRDPDKCDQDIEGMLFSLVNRVLDAARTNNPMRPEQPE